MRTIKSRIGAQAFAWTLILMFLLSSMIGTIAAVKPDSPPGKPDNPGPQPPPPPTLYWFEISIGAQYEDVVLVDPKILTIVSTVDSCGWNWPPKKGTKGGGWSADPNAPWNPEPPDCGEYYVNLEATPDLPNLIDADSYTIHHSWSSRRVREYGNQPIDFWELNIAWGMNYEEPEDPSDIRHLMIWTDWGPELEGDYYLDSEGEVEKWIVDFNGASWELWGVDENWYGYVINSGTIINGFDVTIIKGDLVT